MECVRACTAFEESRLRAVGPGEWLDFIAAYWNLFWGVDRDPDRLPIDTHDRDYNVVGNLDSLVDASSHNQHCDSPPWGCDQELADAEQVQKATDVPVTRNSGPVEVMNDP